jgi:hypothetical protein
MSTGVNRAEPVDGGSGQGNAVVGEGVVGLPDHLGQARGAGRAQGVDERDVVARRRDFGVAGPRCHE